MPADSMVEGQGVIETRAAPTREKPEPALRDPGPDELRAKTLRGGANTLVGQVAKLGLTLASTALLSRLLTPEDFGVFGMVMVVIGFLVAVGDLGLGVTILQRKMLSDRDIDRLFWVGLGLQVALAAATALAAPWIGHVFGVAALVEITVVMALGFVITGLGMVHLALLRRAMRFGTAALIEVAALCGGLVLGLGGALLGFGAWSLVALYLGQRTIETSLAWAASTYRPRLPKRSRDDSEGPGLFGVGGFHSAFSFCNYFARNGDNMLIGWFWGAGALGLYSRAYGLLMLPLVQLNVPISSVSLPALSKLQDEPARFRRVYLRALSLLAYLGLPLVTFTILAAEEIILVMIGPQWVEVVPLFRALGVVGLFQLVTNTGGLLFVATGRTDRMLSVGLWGTTATLVTFVVALPHGTHAMALAYASYSGLVALPTLYVATRGTAVSLRDIGRTLARPAAAACLVACALLAVAPAIAHLDVRLRLTLLSLLAGLAWLASLRLLAAEASPLKLFAELRRRDS